MAEIGIGGRHVVERFLAAPVVVRGHESTDCAFPLVGTEVRLELHRVVHRSGMALDLASAGGSVHMLRPVPGEVAGQIL